MESLALWPKYHSQWLRREWLLTSPEHRADDIALTVFIEVLTETLHDKNPKLLSRALAMRKMQAAEAMPFFALQKGELHGAACDGVNRLLQGTVWPRRDGICLQEECVSTASFNAFFLEPTAAHCLSAILIFSDVHRHCFVVGF